MLVGMPWQSPKKTYQRRHMHQNNFTPLATRKKYFIAKRLQSATQSIITLLLLCQKISANGNCSGQVQSMLQKTLQKLVILIIQAKSPA